MNETILQEKIFLNSSLNLSCPFDNYDSIQWFFNGRMLNGSKLMIGNISVEHKGIYTCRVKNIAGENEHNITLDIHYSPKLPQNTSKVYSYKLQIGDGISFECSLIGYPLPNILWFHNNEKQLINENIFKIKNAKVSDAGNYSCIAINEYGSAEQTYYLYIDGKLNINVILLKFGFYLDQKLQIHLK